MSILSNLNDILSDVENGWITQNSLQEKLEEVIEDFESPENSVIIQDTGTLLDGLKNEIIIKFKDLKLDQLQEIEKKYNL